MNWHQVVTAHIRVAPSRHDVDLNEIGAIQDTCPEGSKTWRSFPAHLARAAEFQEYQLHRVSASQSAASTPVSGSG